MMQEMQEQPLVSVVMATFNEPVVIITKSIESILNQSYQNLELLIADDSYSSETIAVIDAFAARDPRMVVIRKSGRMGFVRSLNEGLRIAKGKYIARMDGDDESVTNRIEKQVSFMERNARCAILGGAMNVIDETDQIVSYRFYPSSGIQLLLWMAFRNPLAHPTVMFRRNIVDEGFYYDETFNRAEDVEYWLRLRNNGFRIMNMKDTLLNYRVIGDLAAKRDKIHFKYNYLARKKNFSKRYVVLDGVSLLVAKLYACMSEKMRTFVYARENKKSI